MVLDLTSLKMAVTSLERAVTRSQGVPEDEEVRDAVIQRFEYTYDLCWKMMKRHLEQTSADPAAVDRLSYRDLIRTAAEKGLVSDVSAWFVYRDQRNITSHTYDAEKAASVYRTALEFLPSATSLLEKLEQSQA